MALWLLSESGVFQCVFAWQCSPTKEGRNSAFFFISNYSISIPSLIDSMIPTAFSSRQIKLQSGPRTSVKLIEQRQSCPTYYIHPIHSSTLLVFMTNLLVTSSDARHFLDILKNSSDKTSRGCSSVAMKKCSTTPLLGFSFAWIHAHNWHGAAGA